MRILQVIDTLGVGGGERVLVDLTNILHEHGLKVEVVILTDSSKLQSKLNKGIKVHILARGWKYNPVDLYRMHVLASKFDIIHVHLRYNLKYVGLAKFLFNGRYKLLLHDHFGDIDRDVAVPKGLAPFLKNVWYVGVYEALSTWAVNVARIPKNRVFTLSNIVRKVDSIEAAVESSETLKLVVVSNFRSSKNLMFALDVMSKLAFRVPFVVDFIGAVVDRHYYDSFLVKVGKHGLRNRVRVYTEIIDVQPILRQYDMAIHTAVLESGPLVLIEYLSQGLPFIAYKTGEVYRQLNKVLPEFFLEHFNDDLWVEEIMNVLKAKKGDIHRRMKDCFDGVYSEESYYRKCRTIYESVIDEK